MGIGDLIQDSVIQSNSSNAERLIIVDTRVQEKDVFLNSVKTNVSGIILDFENDTYESILAKIKNNMINNTLESIAMVSHGQYNDNYSFLQKENSPKLKNISLKDPNFDSWKEFLDFLIKLKTLTSIKYLDLLGCAIVSYDEWKLILNYLETNSGINIRASIDNTGNLVAGGNWILETDNNNIDIDAKQLYFTDEILNFTGLLLNFSTNLDTTTTVNDWEVTISNGTFLIASFADLLPRYGPSNIFYYGNTYQSDYLYLLKNLGNVSANITHTIYVWLYIRPGITPPFNLMNSYMSFLTRFDQTIGSPISITSQNTSQNKYGWTRYAMVFTPTNSRTYSIGLNVPAYGTASTFLIDDIQILQGIITQHPQNKISNNTNRFSVTVANSTSITYQWQSSYNDYTYTNISSMTNSYYDAPALTNLPIMYYRCLINNNIYSNPAYLLNPNYMFPDITASNIELKSLPILCFLSKTTSFDSNKSIIMDAENYKSNNAWYNTLSISTSSSTIISGAISTNYTPTSTVYNNYIYYSGNIIATVDVNNNNVTSSITSNKTYIQDTPFYIVNLVNNVFTFTNNSGTFTKPSLGLDYHKKYIFKLNYTPSLSTLLRFYKINNTECTSTNTPNIIITYFNSSNTLITSITTQNVASIVKIEFTNKQLYENINIIQSSSTTYPSEYITQINYYCTNFQTSGNIIRFPQLPVYPLSYDINASYEELTTLSVTGENNTLINFTSAPTGQQNVSGLKNATHQYIEFYNGLSYQFVCGAIGRYTTDKISVYIDYNGNGNLSETGENALVSGNLGSTGNISLTVPISTTTYNKLIRIRIIFYDSASDATVTSNSFINYGSTYDFSARILPTPTTGTPLSNITNSVSSGNTSSFTIPSNWNATSYQWQVSTNNSSFTDINEAILSSYMPTDTRYITFYRCKLNNGYLYSNTVYLLNSHISLLPSPTSLLNNTLNVNSDIRDISGRSIQWQSNEVNISNAISDTYTPSTLTRIRYQITYPLNGSNVTITSNSTQIIPTISVQPTNIIKDVSGDNTTSFDISSNATLYQWQVSTDNVSFRDITGAQTSSYRPTNTINYITFYKCILNNGLLESNVVYLLNSYTPLLSSTTVVNTPLNVRVDILDISGITIQWEYSSNNTNN